MTVLFAFSLRAGGNNVGLEKGREIAIALRFATLQGWWGPSYCHKRQVGSDQDRPESHKDFEVPVAIHHYPVRDTNPSSGRPPGYIASGSWPEAQDRSTVHVALYNKHVSYASFLRSRQKSWSREPQELNDPALRNAVSCDAMRLRTSAAQFAAAD
jgi:hypothetical protein